MNCDFTTTACLRPSVLKRTLTSFRENLRGIDLKKQAIHLNIDPAPGYVTPGEIATETLDVIDVAAGFFGRVHTNLPAQASFPAAVKWCWTQAKTPVFFHLEDDWELTEPVTVEDLHERLLSGAGFYEILACVSLRAYNWDARDSRICLSPGLFNTGAARTLAARLTLDANPEKQLRPVTRENLKGGRDEGFVGTFWPGRVVLKDIGRDWLEASGWRKERPVHFTNWVRDENRKGV